MTIILKVRQMGRGQHLFPKGVELISRKDSKTQSKRGRMVVGLSQMEHLFTQWVNRVEG